MKLLDILIIGLAGMIFAGGLALWALSLVPTP